MKRTRADPAAVRIAPAAGERMRVLLLSRYARLGASSRVRSYQYLPLLQAEGIEVEPSPLLRDDYIRRLYASGAVSWPEVVADYAHRVRRLFAAARFDLLWIEKELFPSLPAWGERLLSAAGVPYVVDYDDAVFHVYEQSASPLKRLLRGKIDVVMRGAALVVCGNAYLARHAAAAGAGRVEIVPTAIDLGRYAPAERPSRDMVVVGWIGTPNTVKYLDLALPALRELAGSHRVQLRVIGATLSVPGLEVECRPWSEASEVRDLADLDVGIMPLADSPVERGKCGYKLIQYMGCGLPVVASPVGVNQEIVAEGVTGYLAPTPERWYSALRDLCIDADKRTRMGAAGRVRVEQRYCTRVTGPVLVRLLREAAGAAAGQVRART